VDINIEQKWMLDHSRPRNLLNPFNGMGCRGSGFRRRPGKAPKVILELNPAT